MYDIESIIKILRTYRNEFSNEIEHLQELQISLANNNILVTNAGPMNSGKSSLLNAIMGKRDVFKTGDIRETKLNRAELWQKKIELVDTPGCTSTNDSDRKEAFKAFMEADLILFVHNLSLGGIDKQELEVLKYLQNLYSISEFQKRTIIVFSRLDEVGIDDEVIQRNTNECEELIRSNLKVDLQYFRTSTKRYFTGVEKLKKEGGITNSILGNIGIEVWRWGEKSSKLINLSGILKLREFIQNQKIQLGKRGETQIGIILNRIIKKLNDKCSKYQTDIKTNSYNLDKKQKEAIDDWNNSLSIIQSLWDDYISYL